jgi:hypothetical protein
MVRYGTEIIKGVGIPQSGQVILLTCFTTSTTFLITYKLLSRF